jgi:hypothetical protein
MSGHERRKTKAIERKGPAVFTRTKGPASKLKDALMICAWAGCGDNFKFSDGMPKGWTNLIVYSGKPKMNFLDIAHKDCLRDTVLCPTHTQLLESQLKDIERALEQPEYHP